MTTETIAPSMRRLARSIVFAMSLLLTCEEIGAMWRGAAVEVLTVVMGATGGEKLEKLEYMGKAFRLGCLAKKKIESRCTGRHADGMSQI
jgi:hypothetical protein